MTTRSTESRNARRLERLYGTKASGIQYTTVLRLIRDRGLDGAMLELESRGLKPVVAIVPDRDQLPPGVVGAYAGEFPTVVRRRPT